MRTLPVAAVLAAIASSSSGHVPTASSHDLVRQRSSAGDAVVAIRTFQFAPDTVRIRSGSRVTWINRDEIEHTITSGAPDATDNRFHGVVAMRGATHSAVLQEPGTYQYFCDRHRFMTGTIIVSR